jgi:hypothetical protein
MDTAIPKSTDVEVVIGYAETEVRVLLQQRAEITKRLTAIRRTITDLARTFGHNVLGQGQMTLARPPKRNRNTGLTEACRSVLIKAAQPLTAQEIVEEMRASNPELINHHKDPIASATSILLRLESYGEATSEAAPSRRRLWMSKKRDDESPLHSQRQSF